MNRRKLSPARVAPVFFLLTAGLAHPKDGGIDNYKKAREILDQAVAATGGAEKLNGIQTIQLEQKGIAHARNQSPDVKPPFVTNPQTRKSTLDLAQGYGVIETSGSFTGGFVFAGRVIFKGADKFNIDLVNHTVQKNDTLQTNFMDVSHRLFPPLMLRKALSRANTLRLLGDAEIDGQKQDVISFAWETGSVYNLYVDQKTHLLSKYELFFADALTGDATSELYFRNYREADGIKSPEIVHQKLAGDDLNTWTYTSIKINPTLDDAMYAKPADYQELDAFKTPTVEVVELANDVYLVKDLGQGGGYNMLGVVLEDGILAMDAPVNAATAAQGIAKLKEKVPGKPIRTLVLSHHHDDHSGGVGAFVAEGATIVTAADNQAYLERMATSTSTLGPASPNAAGKKPTFELVQGKKSFSDGKRTVEIYDIGPSPHANHMFIAYLPDEKLVFQADQLFKPLNGPMPPVNDVTAHFAKSLETLGLNVERIASVHGEVASMDDLKKTLSTKADPAVVGQLQ